MAAHAGRSLADPLALLDQDLRPGLRHGRGQRRRAVLRIRHELLALFRRDGRSAGPPARLRGDDRFLPRGRLPGNHAVRLEAGRRPPPFHGDLHGRRRHLDLGLLDSRGQFLDAHPRRLRTGRRRVQAGRLGGGDLQPLLPLPLSAYDPGLLDDGLLRHGRGLRPADPARPDGRKPARGLPPRPADGGHRLARTDLRRRYERSGRARVPADQTGRDRSRLGDRGCRPLSYLHLAGHGGRGEPLLDLDPLRRQPDHDP